MRRLRSGYTTGACAAAAAKAAMMLLIGGRDPAAGAREVEIPFPDGARVKFKVDSSELTARSPDAAARASVIKNAGDDPDVTDGVEIVAEARIRGAGMRNPFDSASFDSSRRCGTRSGSPLRSDRINLPVSPIDSALSHGGKV